MRGFPKKLPSRRLRSIAIASAVLATSSAAQAQIANLTKGYSYFVNNGTQIWGLDQGSPNFKYNGLANANFTGVMWSYGQAGKVSDLTTGQKWGKWVAADTNPATVLDAMELSKKPDLLSLQVGDEQQSDLENPNGTTAAWFSAAHSGNYFPNQLLYVNSFFINSDANYAAFIGSANPDAISFDSYPFDEPYGSVILPNNWLALAGRFRRHALSSYITFNGQPIGGNAPRPYGMYIQSYAAQENQNAATRHPGDVEMRWQQFTAWTMGFSWVDAFHTGSSSGSLFLGGDMDMPWQPRYDQFKETARQSRNLSPALTRLISYGYGPSIILGSGGGGTAGVPSDWLTFNASNAPPNQQYLTGVVATNVGLNGVKQNGGLPGDVYVGFFNPLHASFGDPDGEAYFMVTNALGAYLDNENLTVAECTQQITLNFDNKYSGIGSLQRLRRSDGTVEVVPLNRLSGTAYQLVFNLEGGTGDLFKFNDGTPFVGFNNILYWDNDASSSGNNTTTGANMGGTGNWDAASNKWFNGSANGAWATTRDGIFWGTAGTVTLAAPQTVNSLKFKSGGYTLTGSTLNMTGQFITTDTGTTTIASTVAGTGGIAKAGAGTLVLSNAANTYSGGTTVLGGVLQLSSDGALGAAPGTFNAGNITLNGGTLKFGANIDLNDNRGIDLGPAGGTIDTQSFDNTAAGWAATAGGFRGPGDLTKLGSGTFFAAATTGGANTTWKGRLIIKQGTWKIVASDGLPYNVPAGDGVKPDHVTLDGGTWQIGATMSITNGRRGITVTSNGGTIDTPGFDLTWAGALNSSSNAAVLNKTGSGTFHLNGAGTVASGFNGTVNINAGTLRLGAGIGIGDQASINLANVAGATLNITATEVIGSLSGGGLSGGNVTLSNNVQLATGGNNSSTTFGGVISGAGAQLTKVGSGTMTLTNTNTYTGATSVLDGTLAFNATQTSSSSLSVASGHTARITQNGSRVIKAGSVSTTGTGKFDLKDNKAILTAQSGGVGSWTGSAYTGVHALVAQGRGDGSWNGGGITTSMTDATTGVLTTLAVARAGDVGYAGGTFGGVSVATNDVLVMYTWGGDADLSGTLNGDDYFWIDSNILANQSGANNATFHTGDFNYDGEINGDDYFILDSNILQAQGSDPFPTSSGAMADAGLTSVPEPGVVGLVGALGLLARRRRSR